MKDITDNLLHWSWYTTRFLGLIENARKNKSDITVKELEKDYLEQIKNEGSFRNLEFPIINPGYLMMFAYALLVIPNEIMRKEQLSDKDFSFNSIHVFQFTKPKSYDLNANNFLKKMRNSVSHAHYRLESDENTGTSLFTFWDEYNGKVNFKVTTTMEGFWQFLDEVGKYYSNKIGKL